MRRNFIFLPGFFIMHNELALKGIWWKKLIKREFLRDPQRNQKILFFKFKMKFPSLLTHDSTGCEVSSRRFFYFVSEIDFFPVKLTNLQQLCSEICYLAIGMKFLKSKFWKMSKNDCFLMTVNFAFLQSYVTF